MERKGSYTTRKFHSPIDDALDRPIAFNPAFKKITGSTVAALMLSQAWYWSKRTSDEDGWFYKTVDEWEEETGLTRSEQETARKHLKQFMETDLRGVPATLYYRVLKDEVAYALGIQFAETPRTSLPQSSEQDSDIPANINRTENTAEITTVETSFPNLPLDWQIAKGGELSQSDPFDAQARDAANLIATGLGSSAKDGYALAYAFMTARQIIIPTGDIKGQRKAVKSMLDARPNAVKPEHVVSAVRQLSDKGMTISDLFSVSKTAIDLANKPQPPKPNQDDWI